jgi:hypothetical protein
MFKALSIAASVFGFVLCVAPSGAAGAPRHAHLHHSLRELREARTELKEAAHDFGGHRVKALEAVDAAIKQIDAALRATGDNIKGGKVDADIYKKYTHHPHIHHAIHELREARTELREARHNFGGHREAAIRDINYAIEQLELALKFARK